MGSYDTEEKAINRVYTDKVTNELHNVLQVWGTAGTLTTEFAAKAKEIMLRNTMGDSATLVFPNIEGIVSLGHTTTTSEVTVNGNKYQVANEHNEDGTPKDSSKHAVPFPWQS